MYNLPETPKALARILPSNVRKTGVELISAKTNKGYFRAIKACAHRTEFYGRYQENAVTEYYLQMTNRDLQQISFECIPGVVIRDLKGCHLVTEVTLTPGRPVYVICKTIHMTNEQFQKRLKPDTQPRELFYYAADPDFDMSEEYVPFDGKYFKTSTGQMVRAC